MSKDINSFKANLECYQKINIMRDHASNFWEVSNNILFKIDGHNRLQNKPARN